MPRASLITAFLWLGGLAAAAAAQNSGPATIWDGVFTSAQTERGRTAFIATCARCHRQDLLGAQGPPLKGQAFAVNWEGESLNRLFAKVRDTMPPNFGLLEPQTKLDILTYLLLENGYPTGAHELTQDPEALDAILIAPKAATKGVPNFSLVETVGCLTRSTDGRWRLTRASEPATTRDESTPQWIEDARGLALGTETFLLLNIVRFGPEPHAGGRVAVKGLVYRSSDDNRLTLTMLEVVSSTCPQ